LRGMTQKRKTLDDRNVQSRLRASDNVCASNEEDYLLSRTHVANC
jgi:hypothetical protein